MSKTFNALLFKLAMTLVVGAIAFRSVTQNTWEWIALLAVAASVIDYLAGDLLILPKVGSFIGAIINGVLAAAIAVGLSAIVPALSITTSSVATFGILVAVGEYFFHRYLLRTEEVEP